MTDPVSIRAYRSGDEQGIVDSYNQVFPTKDGRIPWRSLAHWRWKFLANPAGQIHITVADHAQQGIVGAYPVLPVRIQLEGKRALAGQPVDLVVVPEFRRYGERPGLFVHLGRKNYALYGGQGEGKCEFHFGWPVPAWRIGKKYLDYENVRDWDFLFRTAGKDGLPERETPAELGVRQVQRYGADVDALWQRLAPGFQLALVRDAAYLNWRYADAHDRSYRLFECREGGNGALRGICVYTVCDFLFPNTAFLVDWLCPSDDTDATVAMVAAAEQQANSDRAGALATLFPQLDPRFLQFQRFGFMVYGTSYFIVLAPFDHRGTVFYREQWYHTCGDSDLV